MTPFVCVTVQHDSFGLRKKWHSLTQVDIWKQEDARRPRQCGSIISIYTISNNTVLVWTDMLLRQTELTAALLLSYPFSFCLFSSFSSTTSPLAAHESSVSLARSRKGKIVEPHQWYNVIRFMLLITVRLLYNRTRKPPEKVKSS